MFRVLPVLAPPLSSLLKSRAFLQLENPALRHQIGVLQRSAKKRPKLTALDRFFWAWLCLDVFPPGESNHRPPTVSNPDRLVQSYNFGYSAESEPAVVRSKVM